MPDPVPCVAGVDGGGSKTACRLAGLDGAVLAAAAGGPSNYQSIGPAATREVLRGVLAEAAARAGRPVAVVGWCLALAGVDRPDDRQAVAQIAREIMAGSLPGVAWRLPPAGPAIVNDAVAALVGGTGRRLGVVVVAGTGSIAFGMNAAGVRQRAGGWGHLLGDEGSGYALGQAALRAVCRAADGRAAATRLTGLVLAQAGVDDPSALVGLAYGTWSVADIAGFAPLVHVAATQGDGAAIAILDDAAGELALAAAAVVGRLGLQTSRFDVVTSGGAWRGAPRLRERFGSRLREVAPQASVIWPRDEPVAGAVLLALESAGLASLA